MIFITTSEEEPTGPQDDVQPRLPDGTNWHYVSQWISSCLSDEDVKSESYYDISVSRLRMDFSPAKIEHLSAENLRYFAPDRQQFALWQSRVTFMEKWHYRGSQKKCLLPMAPDTDKTFKCFMFIDFKTKVDYRV